jgi:hypothetical protein
MPDFQDMPDSYHSMDIYTNGKFTHTTAISDHRPMKVKVCSGTQMTFPFTFWFEIFGIYEPKVV